MRIEVNHNSKPVVNVREVEVYKLFDGLWRINIDTREKYPTYVFGCRDEDDGKDGKFAFLICFWNDDDDPVNPRYSEVALIPEDETEHRMLEDGYDAIVSSYSPGLSFFLIDESFCCTEKKTPFARYEQSQ